jgi:hypothetical protein
MVDIHVGRRRYSGDLKVHIDGLPQGLSADPFDIPCGGQHGRIKLTAKAGALPDSTIVLQVVAGSETLHAVAPLQVTLGRTRPTKTKKVKDGEVDPDIDTEGAKLEQDLIRSLPSPLAEVYLELKRRVLAFGPKVETYGIGIPDYFIFRAGKNIAEIQYHKRQAALRFLVRREGFNIPENQSSQVYGITVTRVPDKHKWTLNHRFMVSATCDLDAVEKLLRRSYDAVATNSAPNSAE